MWSKFKKFIKKLTRLILKFITLGCLGFVIGLLFFTPPKPKEIKKKSVLTCEECKNFNNELCRQGAIDKLKEIDFLDANTPEIYLLKKENITLEAQIYYSECYKLLVEYFCNDLCKGQNK